MWKSVFRQRFPRQGATKKLWFVLHSSDVASILKSGTLSHSRATSRSTLKTSNSQPYVISGKSERATSASDTPFNGLTQMWIAC